MEVVELDESTKENLSILNTEKQALIDRIAHVDNIAQAIIKTVINVKGLDGKWVLNSDFKLVKEVEIIP